MSQVNGGLGKCYVVTMKRLFVAALLFLCVAVATILHSTSLFRLKEIRRHQVFNSYIVRQLVGLSPSNGANMRSEGQVTATTTSRNQTSEFVFDVDQSNGFWKTSYSNVSEDIGWKKPSEITGGESQQIDLQTSPMTHANESTDLDHQKPAIGLLEGLKRIRPQIMSDYPSSFLANYKNPCYKKASDGKLHCLPYFFLLGTPKSGTTDIWSKIVQHPDVVCRAKEPHWWTRKSYPKAPLSVYEAKFMTGPIQNSVNKFSDRRSSVITGDGSASTFWDNNHWESFFPDEIKNGPPYIIADLIHTILPDAKLLVSFRNPTDRLYSDYLYFHRSSKVSAEDFHRRVKASLESFTKCRTVNSLRACAYKKFTDQAVRLTIGLYSVYARDWLQRYPPNQMMFIKLEEWNTQCNTQLRNIFEFLDLDVSPSSEPSDICQSKSKNVNYKKKQTGRMWNSTRTLLGNFYRPFVLDLAAIMNDTKFLWDY